MTEIDVALPAESPGTELTRFNALKHGVLSRYTVLPWEDAGEYRTLVAALVGEHTPQGPTEEHMVEELAGILWRKRRLRLAEAAAYRRGLGDSLLPLRGTVKAALVHLDAADQPERLVDDIWITADQMGKEIREMESVEAMTRHALDLLASSGDDAYEAALAALHDDTREGWQDAIDRNSDGPNRGEKPATADAASLRRFLEREILPWFVTWRKEIANLRLIREQVFGEAFDPDKLERLVRYEVHLDRKLQRILAMLIRLQDLRRASADT